MNATEVQQDPLKARLQAILSGNPVRNATATGAATGRNLIYPESARSCARPSPAAFSFGEERRQAMEQWHFEWSATWRGWQSYLALNPDWHPPGRHEIECRVGDLVAAWNSQTGDSRVRDEVLTHLKDVDLSDRELMTLGALALYVWTVLRIAQPGSTENDAPTGYRATTVENTVGLTGAVVAHMQSSHEIPCHVDVVQLGNGGLDGLIETAARDNEITASRLRATLAPEDYRNPELMNAAWLNAQEQQMICPRSRQRGSIFTGWSRWPRSAGSD